MMSSAEKAQQKAEEAARARESYDRRKMFMQPAPRQIATNGGKTDAYVDHVGIINEYDGKIGPYVDEVVEKLNKCGGT